MVINNDFQEFRNVLHNDDYEELQRLLHGPGEGGGGHPPGRRSQELQRATEESEEETDRGRQRRGDEKAEEEVEEISHMDGNQGGEGEEGGGADGRLRRLLKLQDKNGETLLHNAARCGASQCVSLLLSLGADTEVKNKDDMTPFLLALHHPRVCHQFLQRQSSRLCSLPPNNIALELATKSSSLSTVEVLLENGFDPTKKNSKGYMTLHFGADAGSNQVLNILLKNIETRVSSSSLEGTLSSSKTPPSVADYTNAQAKNRSTPLLIAASKGNAKCCETLLKYGADVAITNCDEDNALHLSCKNGFIQTTEKLLNHISSMNNASAVINAINKRGYTPLHLALKGNYGSTTQIVELLLDYNADINMKDRQGMSPLHLAVRAHRANPPRLVYMLMDRGADTWVRNKEGITPLHTAVTSDSLRTCEVLLGIVDDMLDPTDQEGPSNGYRRSEIQREYYAERTPNQNLTRCRRKSKSWSGICSPVNKTDDKGNTPLHMAQQEGRKKICSLLLSQGANPNLLNANKESPLHHALVHGLYDNCKILINKGANLDACHESLLHVAASMTGGAQYQHAYLLCCKVLVRKGVKMNIKDENGQTALHVASSSGASKICKWLLEKHVNFCKDKKGETPLSIAVRSGHFDCCKVFVSHLLGPNNIVGNDPMPRAILHAIEVAFTLKKDKIFKLLLLPFGPEQPVEFADVDQKCGRHRTLSTDSPSNTLALVDIMSQALKERRSTVVEAIVKSHLWWLAFVTETFPDTSRKRLRSRRTIINQNINELIVLYPDLARILMDRCVERRGTRVYYNSHLFDNRTFSFSYTDSWGQAPPYGDDIGPKTPKPAELDNDAQDPTGEGPSLPKTKTRNVPSKTKVKMQQTSATEKEKEEEEEGEGEKKRVRQSSIASSVLVPRTSEEWRINHPLHLMAKHKKLSLLEHPLISHLLKRKWRGFVSGMYLYRLFLSVLSSFALSVYVSTAWDWETVRQKHNVTQEEICSSNESSWESADEAWQKMEGTSPTSSTLKSGISWRFFLSILIIVPFLTNFRRPFSHCSTTFIKTFSFVTALVLVIDVTECNRRTGVREDLQWACGTLSVMFSWLNVLVLLNKTPEYSTYSLKVTDFLKWIAKLFVPLLILILAFSLSFHMLLRCTAPFNSFTKAFFKMLPMMVGDLGYDGIFNNPEEPPPYPALTSFLFVFYMVLMCVVIVNIITNAPSVAIEKSRRQIKLYKLGHNVSMVLEMESESLWNTPSSPSNHTVTDEVLGEGTDDQDRTGQHSVISKLRSLLRIDGGGVDVAGEEEEDEEEDEDDEVGGGKVGKMGEETGNMKEKESSEMTQLKEIVGQLQTFHDDLSKMFSFEDPE